MKVTREQVKDLKRRRVEDQTRIEAGMKAAKQLQFLLSWMQEQEIVPPLFLEQED